MCADVGEVSSFAGSGASSWADGLGTVASSYAPRGISVSSTGTVFVAAILIRMITTSGFHIFAHPFLVSYCIQLVNYKEL